MWQKIKSFYNQCIRVLKVTDKPSKEEYKMIVKITGIGILIIGFLGFLVATIFHFLF